MGEAKERFSQFLEQQAAKYKSVKALKAAGVPIPKELRIRVQKRVKSKLGSLVLMTNGMAPTPAKATVDRFEKNVGGKATVVKALELLESEGKLTEKELLFLNHLRDEKSKGKSLVRVITEAGMNPLKVMTLYTKGCIEVGKMEAAIEAHQGLPLLVKNLNSHAMSEAGDVCAICVGTGQVAMRTGVASPPVEKECPRCQGLGRDLEPSDLKRFAAEKLLEITKMVEKGGGVTVQTNVGVQVPIGGSVLERVMGAADEVLYRRPAPSEPVVEAEVVSPQSDS